VTGRRDGQFRIERLEVKLDTLEAIKNRGVIRELEREIASSLCRARRDLDIKAEKGSQMSAAIASCRQELMHAEQLIEALIKTPSK